MLSNPGGGLGSFVALGLRAVDTVAPGVGVAQLLTDRARGLFPHTLQRCHDTLQAADSFGAVPLNEILRGDADITRLLDAIGAQDPEHLTIRSRLRVLQGTADGTVLPTFTNQLVDELRGRGAKLAYTTYDGVSHAGVIEAGGADATRWIAKRLG